jgi:hypothetical protein
MFTTLVWPLGFRSWRTWCPRTQGDPSSDARRRPSTWHFMTRRYSRRIGRPDKDSHLPRPSCRRCSDARYPTTGVTTSPQLSSHRPHPRIRSCSIPCHHQLIDEVNISAGNCCCEWRGGVRGLEHARGPMEQGCTQYTTPTIEMEEPKKPWKSVNFVPVFLDVT